MPKKRKIGSIKRVHTKEGRTITMEKTRARGKNKNLTERIISNRKTRSDFKGEIV